MELLHNHLNVGVHRMWFEMMVYKAGRQWKGAYVPSRASVSQWGQYTHTHKGRDGWERMLIPVSATGCQEKLVPDFEVLWPQSECNYDSTCPWDLTPEQSKCMMKEIFLVWQKKGFHKRRWGEKGRKEWLLKRKDSGETSWVEPGVADYSCEFE